MPEACADEASLEAGKKLFRAHCKSCHGKEGRGDGTAAAGLDPPPRNLREDPFKGGEEAQEIKHIATNSRNVGITQVELPAELRPFRQQAQQLNLTEEEVVERLRQFQSRGLMRRFAAVLHHRKVGFRANGMGVWQASQERLEECGLIIIASFSAVSHCYQRATAPVWPYNLFTMVHASTPEQVEELLERIRQSTALDGFQVLYSSREFKKQRLLYFGSDEGAWEERHLIQVNALSPELG